MAETDQDERYFRLVKDAISVCRNYKPKLGKGSKAGFSLEEFQALYREDPFYVWFGLDSPRVYAAHKAAGGLTSVYRQIGLSCERLFQQILQDTLGLDEEDVKWSYNVPHSGGRQRTLSLDARIPIDGIGKKGKAKRIRKWVTDAAHSVNVDKKVAGALQGPVFEVRQGYKSKDAKRQNADIGNAANAYANSYLPVVALLSSQIDHDIAERYARSQWVILRGTLGGSSLESTYVFTERVLGYNLAGFFERNCDRIRKEVESVTKALLK